MQIAKWILILLALLLVLFLTWWLTPAPQDRRSKLRSQVDHWIGRSYLRWLRWRDRRHARKIARESVEAVLGKRRPWRRRRGRR
jgi:hypothetical protein